MRASNPEWGEGPWSQVPPISIVGVTPTHTVGDLARATFESMTYAIACDLERIDALAPTSGLPLILVGGGSRGTLAAQMLADVSGRSVLVPDRANATAMGGAELVAGSAPGGDATPEPRRFEPDETRHAAYRPYVRRYADTFARLRTAFAGPGAAPREAPAAHRADHAGRALGDHRRARLHDRRSRRSRARERDPRWCRGGRHRLAARGRAVRREELSALPTLQWIACVRGGPVNVDIPAATRRGIPVLYAPGRNAAAVADFVIGQIVCLVRHIAQTNHLMRTGALTEERDGRDP